MSRSFGLNQGDRELQNQVPRCEILFNVCGKEIGVGVREDRGGERGKSEGKGE